MYTSTHTANVSAATAAALEQHFLLPVYERACLPVRSLAMLQFFATIFLT